MGLPSGVAMITLVVRTENGTHKYMLRECSVQDAIGAAKLLHPNWSEIMLTLVKVRQ
jgi:hypothetical protein